jgi:hypothetical protein
MQPISRTRRIERPGGRAGATPATCLGWLSLFGAAIWLAIAGTLPAWAQGPPSGSNPARFRPGFTTPRTSSGPTASTSSGMPITVRRPFNGLAPTFRGDPRHS